jgi:hypothetical protein
MDQKLTDELTQALRIRDEADKASRDAGSVVDLLRARWNAELRIGDVVGDRYDGKCEVVKVSDDTIEVKEIEKGSRITTSRKYTPIRDAVLYPWTAECEAQHQLHVRRDELIKRLYDMPAADVARIEEALKSS